VHTDYGRKREGKSTLGDLGVDGILKWILKKGDRKAWIGFIWLRIGTSGGLLCTRYSAFRFHKIRGIYSPIQELRALERDCSPCSSFASQPCLTTHLHSRTALFTQSCWQFLTNVQSKTKPGLKRCSELPRFGSAWNDARSGHLSALLLARKCHWNTALCAHLMARYRHRRCRLGARLFRPWRGRHG